jgi:hypothetical protein
MSESPPRKLANGAALPRPQDLVGLDIKLSTELALWSSTWMKFKIQGEKLGLYQPV